MAAPDNYTEAKYRKLASEYAKLKSQLPVLKQSYLDEVKKEDELKDQLKEKGQGLRKAEQELESLTFRNQQLTRRITILQDELEKTSQSHNKRRGRTDSNASLMPGDAVINEELMNKIKENEKLHSHLTQLQTESDGTIMKLKDRIDTLEYNEKKYDEKVATEENEHKQLIGRLREDKAMLEIRIQNQEQSVKDAKLAASSAEDRLREVTKDFHHEQKLRKKMIEDKVIFHDTARSDLNSLNIPTHNRAHQTKVIDYLKLLYTSSKSYCDGVSDFCCYLAQRCKIYPGTLLDQRALNINEQLCDHLNKMPPVLDGVSESFRKFYESQHINSVTTLDTASLLPYFAENFQLLSQSLLKICNYVTMSLGEESSLTSTTQSCRDQNQRVSVSWRQMVNAVQRTASHLGLVAAQSQSASHPRENQPKILSLLSQSLVQLTAQWRDLSVQYNMKSDLDNQLPTVSPELAPTDKCMTKALLTISTSINKISTFLTEHHVSLSAPLHYGTESSPERKHPLISSYQHSAECYLKSLHRPKPKFVPYKTALHNMETLLSSTESRDSLSQLVDKLNSKASKLEQDREHWMLESQLLKIKLEKHQKLSGMSPRSGSPALNQPELQASDPVSQVNATSTPHSLNGIISAADDADMDATIREKLVKEHYLKRISELTTKLQTSDTNSAAFHAECRALNARLLAADNARIKAAEELEEANSKILHLQDELVTTKKSYDGQLGTMSEALASMNDHLASQTDEIESLKLQLQTARRSKR